MVDVLGLGRAMLSSSVFVVSIFSTKSGSYSIVVVVSSEWNRQPCIIRQPTAIPSFVNK